MSAVPFRPLATLLAALALPGTGFANPASNDSSIDVAIVASLSGPDALGPQDAVDGIRLGMKQLTQRLGNQEAHLEVVDGKDSVDETIEAVRRLLARQHVDFMLTALSPSAFAAVLPMLAEQKVFVVNLGRMPPAQTGAECSPWVFDLAGPDRGLHEAAGAQLAQDKVKRLAVVAPDLPLTADAVAALKRTYPGEVVGVITPKHGATTFEPEMAQLRAWEPDAVYDLLTGGVNAAFLRALDSSGLRSQVGLYAPWPGFDRAYLPAIGDAALDATVVASWAADVDNPLNHKLVSDFEGEYGRTPGGWAVAAYDTAALLDAALKVTKGKTGDSEAVRNAIRHADFASARGAFRFATNQGPVQSYLALKIARDPRGRLAGKMQGMVVKDWQDRAAATACPMRWDTTPKPAVPPPASPHSPPPPAHLPPAHLPPPPPHLPPAHPAPATPAAKPLAKPEAPVGD